MKILLLLMTLSLLPTFVLSQTTVNGNQSGVWSASNSPYLVVGEITVPFGDTLVIEPGVQVKFQGHFKFIINGNLQAQGSETDSITFTTDNPVVGWWGLRFVNADSGSVLSYCRIRNGKSSGSWPDNSGGGVSLWSSDVRIEHCLFESNSSDYLAGALFCWDSTPVVNDCIFTGNDCSYDGGAIYLYFSDGNFTNCTVTGNSTFYYGAALASEGSYGTLTNCVIIDNAAQAEAGAVWAHYSELTFTNCTFYGNATTYGWGGAVYMTEASAAITNSILWNNSGNGGDLYLDVNGIAAVNYTDLGGNFGGVGNINSDPLFVDAAHGDFHLSPTSPCIDAGTAFFELNGDTLVNLDSTQYTGMAPDMGAFEYQPVTGLPGDRVEEPREFALFQNYPNPFNPVTNVEFGIGKSEWVTLNVCDLWGQLVKTLVNKWLAAGRYTVRWDGTNDAGQSVSSGVYFYRLEAGNFRQTRKMLLVR